MSSSDSSSDEEIPKMTKNQVKKARRALTHDFPRLERLPVDPGIPGQTYVVVSYALMKDRKPNSSMVGLMKFRGCFPTMEQCQQRITHLIKNVDSEHAYHIGVMGYWLPISEEEGMAEDLEEVNLNDEAKALHDAKVKEAKQVEKRQAKEIRDRAKELREDVEKDEDTESLDYYCMLQVKRQAQNAFIDMADRRKKETIRKRDKSIKEIHALDDKYPEYDKLWMEKVRGEREKAGIPNPSDNPFEDIAREQDNVGSS